MDPDENIIRRTYRLELLASVPLMALYAGLGLWGSFLGLVPLALHGALFGRLTVAWPKDRRVGLQIGLILLAIFAAAVTERPAFSSAFAWALLIPMGATLLGGTRSGLRWLVVVLVAQVVAALCVWFQVFPTFEVRAPLTFQALRFVTIAAATWALASLARGHSDALLKRAVAADEAKSVFLANISHEIRTPLNGILGMTEALLQRPLGEAERTDLEVVQRSGDTLLRLINDLLDLTKAERGELPIERIPFDLDQLLRDVMQFARSRDGVATRLEAPAGGVVLGDPTRLRQILSNLVSNASKFTTRGEIVVRARREPEDRWRFEVADSGMGMAPETVALLFTPFRQGDASIARRFGGTGLGLALVKSLTERMGGTVEVTSTPGVGTTFAVTLPMPHSQRMAVTTSAVPTYEHLEVLVVDDNPVNLRVAQSMLARLRCQVTTVDTGEAALDVLRARGFDLVLMDCLLPGIDGWDTTRQLHALAGREATPVIALTASATPLDVERCYQAGMLHVLTKPLVFSELCGSLEPYARPAPVTAPAATK